MNLINPAKFPIRSDQLILGLLTSAATDLRTWGDNVYTSCSAANTAWLGLPASYLGAESDRAYALMDQPVAKGTEVMFHAHRAAKILDETETELHTLKGRLVAIEILASLLRNSVKDGVTVPIGDGDGALGALASLSGEEKTITWQEHGPSVRRNAQLLADYQAWETDYNTVMAERATALLQIREVQIPFASPVVQPMPALTSLDPGADQPWGSPVLERRTLSEGLQHLVNQTVDESLTMLFAVGGVNRDDPRTMMPGRYRDEYRNQYWGGMFDSLASIALMGAAKPFVQQRDAGSTNPIALWWAQRHDRGTAAASAMMGIDPTSADPTHQWSQDPWGTGAVMIVGILSLPRGGPLGLLSKVSRLTPSMPPGAIRHLTPTGTPHSLFGSNLNVRTVVTLPPRLNVNVTDVNKLLNGLDAPNNPRPSAPSSHLPRQDAPATTPRGTVDTPTGTRALVTDSPSNDLQSSPSALDAPEGAADLTPSTVERPETPTASSPTVPSPQTPRAPHHLPSLGKPWESGPYYKTVTQADAPHPPRAIDAEQAWQHAPTRDGVPVDHRTGEPLILRRADGSRGWHVKWSPDAPNASGGKGAWLAENPGLGRHDPGYYPPTAPPDLMADFLARRELDAHALPPKGYDEFGNRMLYANYRPPYGATQELDTWNATVETSVKIARAQGIRFPGSRGNHAGSSGTWATSRRRSTQTRSATT